MRVDSKQFSRILAKRRTILVYKVMAAGLSTWTEVPWLKYPGDEAEYRWYFGLGTLATNNPGLLGKYVGRVRRLRYHGFGTIAMSSPGLQADGRWAQWFGCFGLGTLAMSNHSLQTIGRRVRYPSFVPEPKYHGDEQSWATNSWQLG